MQRFRSDNTEGYSDADIAQLNAAFDREVADQFPDTPREDVEKSALDNIAERLLALFDSGARGAALSL